MIPGLPGISGGAGGITGGNAGPATAGGAINFGNFMSGNGSKFDPFAANQKNENMPVETIAVIGIILVGVAFILAPRKK